MKVKTKFVIVSHIFFIFLIVVLFIVIFSSSMKKYTLDYAKNKFEYFKYKLPIGYFGDIKNPDDPVYWEVFLADIDVETKIKILRTQKKTDLFTELLAMESKNPVIRTIASFLRNYDNIKNIKIQLIKSTTIYGNNQFIQKIEERFKEIDFTFSLNDSIKDSIKSRIEQIDENRINNLNFIDYIRFSIKGYGKPGNQDLLAYYGDGYIKIYTYHLIFHSILRQESNYSKIIEHELSHFLQANKTTYSFTFATTDKKVQPFFTEGIATFVSNGCDYNNIKEIFVGIFKKASRVEKEFIINNNFLTIESTKENNSIFLNIFLNTVEEFLNKKNFMNCLLLLSDYNNYYVTEYDVDSNKIQQLNNKFDKLLLTVLSSYEELDNDEKILLNKLLKNIYIKNLNDSAST